MIIICFLTRDISEILNNPTSPKKMDNNVIGKHIVILGGFIAILFIILSILIQWEIGKRLVTLSLLEWL